MSEQNNASNSLDSTVSRCVAVDSFSTQATFDTPLSIHGPAACFSELQTAFETANQTYAKLKAKGKLDDAQHAMLISQTNPKDLLEFVSRTFPRSQDKSEEKKLVELAESSADIVNRFDSELGHLTGGASTLSMGIPSMVWAGFKFAIHVANDVFSTPSLIIEVVAKVLVLMPRVILYWELSHDQQVLDVKPMLIDIYKTIISLNLEIVLWYTSSRLEQFKKGLKRDPRAHFQGLLVKITEASEEMHKRIDLLQAKAQEAHLLKILSEIRKFESEQDQRIDKVLDLIHGKYKNELAEQARQIEQFKAEQQKKAIEEVEKKAKKVELGSFMECRELREAFWKMLQKPPFEVIHESYLDLKELGHNAHDGRNWCAGHYTMKYPEDDGLAEVSFIIDWRPTYEPTPSADDNSENATGAPSFSWMINVPNSLYYPGRHFGHFKLRERTISGRLKPNYAIFTSRFQVLWESPVFSPFLMDSGRLSSDGPLEETAAPLVLERALKSLAHFLAYGPLPTGIPLSPFRYHFMDKKVEKYLKEGGEEKYMRASSFFANAFSRDLEEDAFEGLEVHEECLQVSIMAIQELVDFYKLRSKLEAKIQDEGAWSLDNAYDGVYTQTDVTKRDQYWASLIAELADLRFVSMAATAWKNHNGIKAFETFASKLPSSSSSTNRTVIPPPKPPQDSISKEVTTKPTPSAPRVLGMYGLANDRLPLDWTPLHLAIWHNNLALVIQLADQSSVRAIDDVGYTPLHLACSSSTSSLFISRQKGSRGLCNLEISNPHNIPFRRDSEGVSLEIVRVLLSHGADANAEACGKLEESRSTPMHCVASSGWKKTAYLLLDHGGSVYTKGRCPPYCWAHEEDTGWRSDGDTMTMKELMKVHFTEQQWEEVKEHKWGRPDSE